jgi:putative ABC transport system substrate-binding protein
MLEVRDYVLDFAWAEGRYERFPELAVQLVQRKPTVILATTISAVRAAQRATTTIPIAMTSINDPVGAGLVQSLSRPGGNTTGLASLAEDVTVKFVELLGEAFPQARRPAVLLNPTNSSNNAMFKRLEAVLAGYRVHQIAAINPDALEDAFTTASKEAPDALLVLPDFMLIDSRYRIASLALKFGLPTITNVPEFSEAGGLINYGSPRRENYRRSAHYVKRIVDGASPANLPVEQPTAIKLSINLATAKALGLDLPSSLLTRADEVIE